MIVERIDSFSSLKNDWKALLDNANTKSIFQTYEWLSTWWVYFGGNKQLYLLIAIDDNQIVGIAPLMMNRMRVKGIPLFNSITFVGSGPSDYMDFIMRVGKETEILKSLTDYFMKDKNNWDLMQLSDVPEDSYTNRLLPELLAATGSAYRLEECSVCPYINLPPAWADYKSLLSRTTRNNLKMYSSRLAKKGNVNLSKVEDKTKKTRAIDEFYDLLTDYQRKGYGASADSGSVRDFHREVADKLSDYVVPFFLELNEKPIAGMYCYDYGDTRYFYGIGWDSAYAHCSPGFITINKVIENAINTGCQRFDFLRGDESYKFHFTKTRKTNRRYLISHSQSKLNLYLFLRSFSRKKQSLKDTLKTRFMHLQERRYESPVRSPLEK